MCVRMFGQIKLVAKDMYVCMYVWTDKAHSQRHVCVYVCLICMYTQGKLLVKAAVELSKSDISKGSLACIAAVYARYVYVCMFAYPCTDV